MIFAATVSTIIIHKVNMQSSKQVSPRASKSEICQMLPAVIMPLCSDVAQDFKAELFEKKIINI